MVFRSVVTIIAWVKIIASISFYCIFLSQVFLQISSKFTVIKSLFGNVLNPGKYDLRKDALVTIGGGFVIHLASLLLASDRLSTCILQDLRKYQIGEVFATLIAGINNLTYLFKLSMILAVVVILIRRAIAYRRNGDIVKFLRNLGWLLFCCSLLLLHVLDPSSDYLLGHWKN